MVPCRVITTSPTTVRRRTIDHAFLSSHLPLFHKHPTFFLPTTMRATTHSSPNRTLSKLLIYLLILTAPYTAWHFLRLIFHTSSPLVFVTSESMSPVYQRGDILFVSNRTPAIELGDVVVCWFEGRKLPFVHRVIEKHVLPARVAPNQRYDTS